MYKYLLIVAIIVFAFSLGLRLGRGDNSYKDGFDNGRVRGYIEGYSDGFQNHVPNQDLMKKQKLKI